MMRSDAGAQPQPWSVLLACALPEWVVARFAEVFHLLAYDPDQPIGPQTAAADALLVDARTRMDGAAIAALSSRVKAVGTYSVGHEHVDRQALAARGIPLLSTPDVLSPSVAETAVFLALGAMRRGTESIRLIRSGQWPGWAPTQLIGRELKDKTAGILGMGRIGRAIAHRLHGLDMRIAYHNRSRLAAGEEGGAVYCPSPAELLGVSDLLVLACPSTPETQGFLDAARIARMKRGAFVVNIARGDVVDDDALIAALADGRIGAAGLDVFNNEPGLDRRYFDLPNVFMLPHIGSSTVEARTQMGDILIDGLLALRRGDTPQNLVSLNR
jgi:glyoxylate reductase